MLVSKLSETIERQDEMTKIMETSLKKAGKKIHRLELMMHNEPSEDAEAYEKQLWRDKMNKLLNYDVSKRLPTLKEIQLANNKKQKTQMRAKSFSRRGKSANRKARVPEQKKSVMKKIPIVPSNSRSKNRSTVLMGTPSIDGQPISVIKNYKGLNSSCGDERVLRRIDGRYSRMNATSSLPSWIGPGHYADSLLADKTSERPESSYQVPFKSTGRVINNSDHHKAKRMEQLSIFSARSEEDPPHSHSSPSVCSRGHNLEDFSDMLNENAWSCSSSQSTIGRPSSQSGRESPKNVYFHESRPSTCPYEDAVSEFIGFEPVSSPAKAIGMEDSVHLDSLDSVVLKAAEMDKRRYVNEDFAKGGLELQQDIPVLLLDEDDNTSSQQNRNNKPKNKGGKVNGQSKSKAQALLASIKRDLAGEKTFKLRNEKFSYTDSVSSLIDDWQTSQNVTSSGRYVSLRKKKNKPTIEQTNDVNLDQLLMDDTGLTYEESKRLAEEYAHSMQTNK